MTHYEFNPYTYSSPRYSLDDIQIQANFFRKAKVEKTPKSNFKNDFYVEFDPAHVGYRAFFLNIQFMGKLLFTLTLAGDLSEDDRPQIDIMGNC